MSAFEKLYEQQYGKFVPPPTVEPTISIESPPVANATSSGNGNKILLWLGVAALVGVIMYASYKLKQGGKMDEEDGSYNNFKEE